MLDIQILPKKSGQLVLSLLGKTQQTAFLLYQKIIIMFLTNSSSLFRQNYGSSLLTNLGCCNHNLNVMSNTAQMAKQQVLNSLDLQDKNNIQSLQVQVIGSQLAIKVTAIDGSEHQGVINVDNYT